MYAPQGTQAIYINKNKCTAIYLCSCVFLSRLERFGMRRSRFTTQKDIGTQVNNSTFTFIDIKRLGLLCTHLTEDVKDDFQSVLRCLSTLMFMCLTPWNARRCYSFRTTYLITEAFQIIFPTASLLLQL